MPNNTAPYDTTKVGRLKHLLNNYQDKGKPKFYEIFVDKMKVVEKTDDVSEFENYLDFMDEDTQEIKILIYNTGNSPRNDQFTFDLKKKEKQAEPKQEPVLSGIDIENRIGEKLQEERRKWDMEMLSKENSELKTKVQEAEEFIGTLQKGIDELKTKGKNGSIQFGEVVSVALEGLIRRNSGLIGELVGGQGLAGGIQEDTKEPGQSPASPQQETAASFKRKEPAENLSDQDKECLEVMRMIQGNFNESQLKQVYDILRNLSADRSLISTVLELLEGNKQHK